MVLDKDFSRLGWTEIAFGVFTFGFLLDEFAAMQVRWGCQTVTSPTDTDTAGARMAW